MIESPESCDWEDRPYLDIKTIGSYWGISLHIIWFDISTPISLRFLFSNRVN